jgi:Spy/CpxP family protein refolding chaperone
MKHKAAAAVFLAVWLCAVASGQTPPGGEDPLARYLFPPDKVLGHAQEIGLDDAQRNSIRNEVQKAQKKFLDLQFDLQTESEKMTHLLQEKPVDEAKVLAEVDRVLALEKDIKKTHISLLIRIKNLLTAAQQAKLSEIQKGIGR